MGCALTNMERQFCYLRRCYTQTSILVNRLLSLFARPPRINSTSATSTDRPRLDKSSLEAHHRHKVDAPSGTALMLGWSRAWRCGRARRPSPPTPRPSRPEATGESEGKNDHRRTLDASPHASGRPSHSAFDGGGPLQARTRPRRTGERPSMGVTIGTDSRPLAETKIT